MRKGFTLVELLAVIVILAIIALITVPIIMNVVESSKKGAVKESPQEWFIFEDNSDGTATITGVSDVWKNLEDENKYDIAIPSKSTNGNSVTTIGEYAFNGNNLTSIVIPKSVTTIGGYAFEYNNLTNLVIPDNVITIEDGAFEYNNLESLDLGNGVQAIEGFAFSFNKLTGELVIPNSVTTIGAGAFADNLLTNLTIPKSVTTIGPMAFNTNLLPDEQAFIYKRNEDGTEDKTTIVSYGGSKKDINIPNNTIIIGLGAFMGNNLTSVIIPNSITTIGDSAFEGNNLTNIIIPENIITIESYAFRKDDYSNLNLTKIINKTGKEFDWDAIINGSIGKNYTFVKGTVESDYGNVEVTDTE